MRVRPWYYSIAPAYLGAFVWIAWFDELWVGGWGSGGGLLLPGQWLSDLVCAGLFFYPLSCYGLRTRYDSLELARQTLGAAAGDWLLRKMPGILGLFFEAVGLRIAVETCLLALLAWGLVDRQPIEPVAAFGLLLRSPLHLGTALFWLLITTTAEIYNLAGVIAALMRVYAPTALVVITLTGGAILLVGGPAKEGSMAMIAPAATPAAVTCGYFAILTLPAATWGSGARRPGDLAWGALTGIALPSAWIALITLLVVPRGLASGLDRFGPLAPAPGSFRAAILHNFPPLVAGIILIALALAAVAPVFFAGHLFVTGWRNQLDGKPRRPAWTAAIAVWLLTSVSLPLSFASVATVAGDLCAPLLGAMLAAAITPAASPSPHPRVRPAGLLAWAAGAGTGLALDTPGLNPGGITSWLLPSSLVAFLTALLLASLLRRTLDLQGNASKPA